MIRYYSCFSSSSPFVQHQPAVYRQQIPSDRVEPCPAVAIRLPFPAVRAVHRLPSFAVESDGPRLHVLQSAVLLRQVAVAAQGHGLALDGYDTMKHIVAWRYLRQYGVPHLHRFCLHQQRHVAVVLQKRTHRVASEPKCHRVAFVQQPNDLGYEDGVGYLHLPIPLLWPDSTPSLPPRWADSGACRSVSGRSPPTSCHRPGRAASRPISSTSTTAAVSPVPAAARAYPPSWPAPGLSG